jgi:hypothetical protein
MNSIPGGKHRERRETFSASHPENGNEDLK